MIDKNNFPLRIEGRYCILEEISPKYFQCVIDWRNDPEINKFLNQPFKLTMELEKSWYENKYLKDDTQGLLIIIDKATNTPIGTTGWTDIDLKARRCIKGRLLLGDNKYGRHPAFMEGLFLATDYIYQFVDIQYGHVVKENFKSVQNGKWMGFELNTGEIQYPHELLVNGMEQQEFYCTKEMYLKARKRNFERFFERTK